MDRFVILVDAGYLYAAGGEICLGTNRRHAIRIDPERVTSFLRNRCTEHCTRTHLRTYWYDAAPDALPTPEQLRFAAQQGVKLRMGRLTPHGQKGVDSRIVRDLIVLPRNGAVSTIYLMSGDEDVREGVAEAQELGVSVVLLGIEAPRGRFNQATTLMHEADEVIVLSRTDCLTFLFPADERRALAPAAEAEPAAVGGGPEAIGVRFGSTLRVRVPPDAAIRIAEDRPRIPRVYDSAMLREASDELGGVEIADADRRALRRGFWIGFDRGAAEAEAAD